MKKIIKNYSLAIITSTILGLIFTPILTWNYSDLIIEKYLLIVTAINLLGLILPLGLDEAIIFFYNKEDKNKSIIECAFPGLLLIILVSPAIGFFLIQKLDLSAWQAGLIIVTLVFYHINRFASLVNRMMFDHVWFPINTIVIKIIPVVIILVSVLLGQNTSINFLLFGLLCTAISTSVIYIRYLVANTDLLQHHFCLSARNIMEKLKYGVPLQLAILANWAILNTDKPFLAIFSDSFNVSCLAIIGAVGSLGMVIQSMFSTIWMPYGMASAIENEVGFKENAKKILEIQKRVSWILVSLSLIFSPLVIKFFPEKFQDIFYVIPLTLLPPIIYSSSEVINIIFNIKHKQNLLFYITIFGLSLNVLINYLYSSNGYIVTVSSIAISYVFIYVAKLVFIKGKMPGIALSEFVNILAMALLCAAYLYYSRTSYLALSILSLLIIFYQARKLFIWRGLAWRF